MNDRHLFRGKRIDNGEWVIGSPVTYLDKVFIYPNDWAEKGEHYLLRPNEVTPSTVGQCTGLKDKNGKLVFEGDILKQPVNNTHRNIIVVWHNNAWKIKFNAYGSVNYYLYVDDDDFFNSCELIGNVHEDGELLCQ